MRHFQLSANGVRESMCSKNKFGITMYYMFLAGNVSSVFKHLFIYMSTGRK